MAIMKLTFLLFTVFLFAAANTHAFKLTAFKLTPSLTLPPKPSVTLPPTPAVTLPPTPSVTLPPKPSVTLPPTPAATLLPMGIALSPMGIATLPPMGVAAALPPKPAFVKDSVAQVKVLVQNEANRAFTIKAAEMKKKLKKKAKDSVTTAKPNQWNLVGVYEVGVNVNESKLLLTITVKNDRNVAVQKTMVVDLLKRFKTEMEGKKFVVLKAVEETKRGLMGKKEQLLKLLMDAQVVLTINLSL